MAQAVETAARGELRRAGLPAQGKLARLLIALRAAAETHLTRGEIDRLAAAAGLGLSAAELASQLATLEQHGLLARLPSTGTEPVFDTVPAPHSHLLYEETAQVVDLDVSAETLIAILRQALAERPGEVDILVRFRRPGG